MRNKIICIKIIFIFIFLSSFAYADMGAHPEATFSITLDGKPFNNALVSVQECQESERYGSSDYSLAGLGEASKLFESNFLFNVLEPDENGNYMSREEIEAYKNELSSYEESLDMPWNDEQLQQARQFILDEFDEEKQCYWQPSERSFTDCENVTCRVTYSVPSLFRIKVLDLESGKIYKIYKTGELQRTGLMTSLLVDFSSSGEEARVVKLRGRTNRLFAAIIFPLAFIANMMIELLAAIILAYFAFKVKIKKIIAPILLGNLITHPLVYFAPLFFNFESAFMIALGMDIIILVSEAFAVVFESFLMARMAKIKWIHAVWISFIINLISLFIGAFIVVQ